ncbi:hypothetical protein [Streptomyces chromofuscus]|uniref:HU family DNA-binding protein n=1 Tax=Streptomyces chromofuscus TaxID=42881 RepID=A0A7M2T8A2_STRCW|nr:hypothetical protein [Streptomyces chromofuscus]QOV44802.1 hypothetical protein IPT68_01940 [Streptomyces chromofuscus]GGT00096.1 hypothetical protein GCM10010254_20170 [Streptomyces chromofuscus]
MDRTQLIDVTARRAAEHTNGRPLAAEDINRVLEALFGTVEHPGSIAEALRAKETVILGSFGSFQATDGTAAFRPGKALDEYLQGKTG